MTRGRYMTGVSAGVLMLIVPVLALAQAPYSANVTTGHPFAPALLQINCNDPGNLLTNCGFETGDFTGWVTSDLASPLVPLQVVTGGINLYPGLFITAPTEGTYAAGHGFDGSPGTIEIGQDVTLPADSITTLRFDYRGAWDLTFGATVDRTFEVVVEPSGGGAPLQSDLILTAPAGDTVFDTGNLAAMVEAVEQYGQY